MSEPESNPKNPFAGFRVPIDPEKVDETLGKIRERANAAFQQGRYTKVRLSYKGKAIAPDLPLGVLLATEGVAFWLMSPLPALLVNLGAKAFLDVEFIHEADELVREGVALYIDGEIEAAEAKYREALRRRADDPSALYNLGTLLRVTGRVDEAKDCLRRAAMGPEGHPDVARASEALGRLDGGGRRL
jgi:tetratricopeptide (TPR) repeat protein